MRSSRLKLLALLGRMDKIVLVFHLLLLAVGVLFIYGAGTKIGGDLTPKWHNQLAWIAVGGTIYLTCALFDYHKLGDYSWIFYTFGLFLLILVLFIGKEINYAKSWLAIGGFTLQPSELAKPATLLFVCWSVTHKAWTKSPVPPWLLVMLIILPPLALILAQPDTGTALVFIPFSLAIAFVMGLHWKWLCSMAVALVIIAPFAFQHLKPHQQERIKVFLEPPSQELLNDMTPFMSKPMQEELRRRQSEFFAPSIDPATGKVRKWRDWNALQSLRAVGSGGMFGKGFRKGTQYVLGYLPQTVAPTDFIFSVIAEETGFLGSALLLVCLLNVILCGCRTAFLASDAFGLCLALGVAVIFATHTFINIAMTVQAAPIIGIPLPFVSYGGSFMLSTMILAGLSQSVHIHRENSHDE